jgi:predicted transcriptional regulator
LSKAKVSDVAKKRLAILDCNSSMQQVAETMAVKRVSAVVLIDSGKHVGILTERDLARQVCAKDLAASKTPATALMSAPVVTVNMDSTIQDAAEMMMKNGVRHLTVKDTKHNLVGIITATDMAWYLGRKAFVESSVLDLLYPYEERGEEMP